jgi:bifunctional DNA-binding transcriptional regulator/antitoxin component of YhaV-PrlF toxin-antitoxin module
MPRVSSKNQITVPVAALRAAGLGPGDEVAISVPEEGTLVVEAAEGRVRRHAGTFDATVFPPGYLEELRAEWER